MKSVATKRFWAQFRSLPPVVQDLGVKSYRLWCDDPSHPSLRFRRLQGSKKRFTVRIGDQYRALGTLDGDTITWVWIGTHNDYDQMTGT